MRHNDSVRCLGFDSCFCSFSGDPQNSHEAGKKFYKVYREYKKKETNDRPSPSKITGMMSYFYILSHITHYYTSTLPGQKRVTIQSNTNSVLSVTHNIVHNLLYSCALNCLTALYLA